MTRRIDRVVAYGCSWTAGSELLDHVHMNMTFDECNIIKSTYVKNGRSLENMQKFIERYDINSPINIARNHASSWAGQLATLLGKPFENRAMGGTGLDQIYLTLFNDYLSGKILPTDLVLVGLTSAYRLIKFSGNKVSTLLAGHNITSDDKLFVEVFNDDFAVFQYYKTLGLLANLKSKINIRLQPVIYGLNPSSSYFTFDLKHVKPYVDHVWNEAQDVLILANDFLEDYIVDGIPRKCGFFHQPIESHTELANKIYNQVKFQ